ncbi:MAG: PfkB family carbohydrate kinase [Planctomycetota bacterium]|jgi:sugar/nucleoside kinase (ribokinase family)
MPLVVVGSVALDRVETPSETRDDLLGGSGSYFAYAASYFTPVKLVSVVGEDWPEEHTRLLQSRGVDTAGLQLVSGAKTFRWSGRYLADMNQRETLEVHLNAMNQFDPVLPEAYRRCKFLFLANDPPALQLKVLGQCPDTVLTVADTMDLWINGQRDGLLELLTRIDGLVLNDSEAILLTGETNLVRAGQRVRELGPRFVVVKKGEHGAMFFGRHETYVLPAFPTPDVVDPTGAGDSFAGGMMGYLAEQGDCEPGTFKRALAYGTLAASFTVEDFSLDRLRKIEREDLEQRMVEYRRMLSF